MKTEARHIKVGDIIIIPQVHAVVTSIDDINAMVASISDHHMVVFDVACKNGPFRGFKGKCTAVGSDKLTIVKRISTWTKIKNRIYLFLGV